MLHSCRSDGIDAPLMSFERIRGITRLGLEVRREADVDDGAPGAGHPALII
jgi:hypothetical protein